MFNERHIPPTKRQIAYYQGIANGNLGWYVCEAELRSVYGETHENGDPKELAKMIASEHITELKASRIYAAGMIEICKLEQTSPTEWSIEVLPTQYLYDVLSALKRGVWWNNKTSSPDYERTELEWRKYLDRGMITDEVFESAGNNRDEELKGIRGELLMFKLGAHRVGDSWRKQDAA